MRTSSHTLERIDAMDTAFVGGRRLARAAHVRATGNATQDRELPESNIVGVHSPCREPIRDGRLLPRCPTTPPTEEYF